jgi:hypothetical protein
MDRHASDRRSVADNGAFRNPRRMFSGRLDVPALVLFHPH